LIVFSARGSRPRRDVLYLGDGSLATAARYVAGVLSRAGLSFDHVPSATHLPPTLARRRYRLILLSDYPAASLGAANMGRLEAAVREGSGLLMIGGWASFTGATGRYRGTQVGDLLPVVCGRADDRIQGAVAYRIVRGASRSALPGFDLRTAPAIAGYNRVELKAGAREILAVETLVGTRGGGLRPQGRDPLLVTGDYGDGRVGALTTDLAPHWSGGLVDWGERRVRLRATGAGEAEVGETYVRFVEAIVRLFLPQT
jgi:hypothetical protein